MAKPSARLSVQEHEKDSLPNERPRTPLAVRPPSRRSSVGPLRTALDFVNIKTVDLRANSRPVTYRKSPTLSGLDIPRISRYSDTSRSELDVNSEDEAEPLPVKSKHSCCDRLSVSLSVSDISLRDKEDDSVNILHDRVPTLYRNHDLRKELGVKESEMEELAYSIQEAADGIEKVNKSTESMKNLVAFDVPIMVSEISKVITELEEEDKLLDQCIVQEEILVNNRDLQFVKEKQALFKAMAYVDEQIGVVRKLIEQEYGSQRLAASLET